MTTEVDVVNIALTLLGGDRIGALTDPVKPARDASAIFSAVRDELLTRYTWTFAKKRGQASSAAAPMFGFNSAYNLPSDCLRVVRPGARYPGPDLTDYRIGPTAEYSIEGRQILTDWPADGTNGPADSDKIASISVDAGGWSWTTQPTITIAAPPVGGIQATAVGYLGLAGVGPLGGGFGAGYSIFDLMTLNGGVVNAGKTAKFVIFRGLAGVPPFRFDVSDPGEYTALGGIEAVAEGIWEMSGLTAVGGSGAGIQIDTWWRVIRIQVTNPGAGYLVAPAVVITNPASHGTNAVASAHMGDHAAEFLHVVYVARIEDPNAWDPFFVKLMGAQLAMDLAESLTQSTAKRNAATDYFVRTLKEAIRNNAIQLPPDKLPDDEWMLSRR